MELDAKQSLENEDIVLQIKAAKDNKASEG